MKCEHPISMMYKIDNFYMCAKCKTKFMKTKKVTISLTAEQQQQAKEISKEVLGNENISGLFAYWINQHLMKRTVAF